MRLLGLIEDERSGKEALFTGGGEKIEFFIKDNEIEDPRYYYSKSRFSGLNLIEKFVQKYTDLTYIEVIEVSVKTKDGSMKSVQFEPDPDIGVDWWDILSHLRNVIN